MNAEANMRVDAQIDAQLLEEYCVEGTHITIHLGIAEVLCVISNYLVLNSFYAKNNTILIDVIYYYRF